MNWTDYFLKIAMLVAQKSKDPSTQAGALITTPAKHIIATGYNGLPRGVADTDERLTNRALKYPMVIHAEKNAIYTAGRDLTGHALWCTHTPCAQCAAAIIQVGIVKVACLEPTEDMLSRWSTEMALAAEMFHETGVEYSEHPDPYAYLYKGLK